MAVSERSLRRPTLVVSNINKCQRVQSCKFRIKFNAVWVQTTPTIYCLYCYLMSTICESSSTKLPDTCLIKRENHHLHVGLHVLPKYLVLSLYEIIYVSHRGICTDSSTPISGTILVWSCLHGQVLVTLLSSLSLRGLPLGPTPPDVHWCLRGSFPLE